MRVFLYAKMLKKTKTEETIVFFVPFLSLVAVQLGGGGGWAPWAPYLATPMLGEQTPYFQKLCRQTCFCTC